MADSWVSSQASGGGDGSQASPWTLDEARVNAVASETDAIRVMDDGTHTLSGPWPSRDTRIVGQGNKPKIEITSTSGTMFNHGGNRIELRNLHFDGLGNSVSLVSSHSDLCSAVSGCLIERVSNAILRLDSGICEGNSFVGVVGQAVRGAASNCYFENCFETTASGSQPHSRCIYKNVDVVSRVLAAGHYHGCVFYNSFTDSIHTGGASPVIGNALNHCNTLTGSIIWFDDDQDIDRNFFVRDSGYINLRSVARKSISGGLDSVGLGLDDNPFFLTFDPFVDAANGDFTLNEVAGGGAVLRAATEDFVGTTVHPFAWLAGSGSGSGSGGGGGVTTTIQRLRGEVGHR